MLQVFGCHEVYQTVDNVIKELQEKKEDRVRLCLAEVFSSTPPPQETLSALPQFRSPV